MVAESSLRWVGDGYNQPSSMSLELFNESISISRRFSREFLSKALKLACLYGWCPQGTRAPEMLNLRVINAEWDGAYLTNDGQVVTAEDARSLACALEKSLDDIPDDNLETIWNSKYCIVTDLPEWLAPYEKELIDDGLEESLSDMLELHPFEFFAGNEKQNLIQFIRFCKLGSFIVL